MHWYDNASRGKSLRYESVLFDHEWDNLENGDGGLSKSRNGSSSSLSSPDNLSGSGGTTTPNNNTKVLSAGNHEFPFEMVIPGDTPESIEGLEGAQIIYRLVAIVERGRFQNNLISKKHIRVVRTIGADNFDLSQTVSISNTWPRKVDYTVEIPTKAVAVGSSFPVRFTLVPMLKGLKLGNIKTHLVEYVSLATPYGSTTSSEKICNEYTIQGPEDGMCGQDSWELNEMIQLPTSLSKCTQDCALNQFIKVAHKIKFAVSLINPDGHVSELRASLPIYLFISPNVPISSLDPTNASGKKPEEEVLFGSHSREQSSTAINNLDAGAPPNYEDHVYDRLWNGVPTPSLESPEGSVASTPYLRSRRSSLDHDQLVMTALDPIQRSQLAAGLRALELQQQGSNNFSPSVASNSDNSRSPSGSNTPHIGPSDYFQNQILSGAHLSPEISHLSRVGTPLLGPRTPEIDLNELSKVPSYSTAIRDDGIHDSECAPGYDTGVSTSPPLAMPTLAHLSAPGNSIRRGNGGTTHVSSQSSSSSALSIMNNHYPIQNNSGSNSGSISRSSSSTGLNFMNRNSSSRSLFEEAGRLIRLTGDKNGKSR